MKWKIVSDGGGYPDFSRPAEPWDLDREVVEGSIRLDRAFWFPEGGDKFTFDCYTLIANDGAPGWITFCPIHEADPEDGDKFIFDCEDMAEIFDEAGIDPATCAIDEFARILADAVMKISEESKALKATK